MSPNTPRKQESLVTEFWKRPRQERAVQRWRWRPCERPEDSTVLSMSQAKELVPVS